MSDINLESKLEDVTFWCKSILTQPEDKNSIGYLYVHAQLLLDEIQNTNLIVKKTITNKTERAKT